MLEITIQIKDSEEPTGYRTLMEGPLNTDKSYYLLPPFVQKCFDAWKEESPDIKDSHGEKMKDYIEILWHGYRFFFNEVYWD